MKPNERLEEQRLSTQATLDAQRTAEERNRDGQFATPPDLARSIARTVLEYHGSRSISLLEPSCGSGAFISALLAEGAVLSPSSSSGIELDPRFADAAATLWGPYVAIENRDFFDWARAASPSTSLLVANPPYVRHHHLSSARKKVLVEGAHKDHGLTVSGLAGLYVHFVLAAHKTLAADAVSAWLIPSEFMEVNYGTALKKYLSEHVELLRVHRFDSDSSQFDDALVSSSVVIFKNTRPRASATPLFTSGGSLEDPSKAHQIPISRLSPHHKWTAFFDEPSAPVTFRSTLGDYFTVSRGIATGDNATFIRPRSELDALGIKDAHYVPILPSPRNLPTDIVESDSEGWPTNTTQLALITTGKPMEQLQDSDPALAKYLAEHDKGAANGYLLRQRNPWYRQEVRPAPPFLTNYMGRSSSRSDVPMRFIRNNSRAIATNSYLMLFPKPPLDRHLTRNPALLGSLHAALNSFTPQELRRGGRTYGGGLQKLEPKELSLLDGSRLRAALEGHGLKAPEEAAEPLFVL